MIVPVSVTALAIFAAFSRNALGDDGDFRLENDILMSSSNMKDVKKLLKYEDNLEYFKPRNENITVIKNQIHGECILNLNVNNVTEVLNLKNKFYTREELSEDEMNGIFGKDILDFCNDLKIIIALKNFDDYHFFTENRSKRSTNEKRYQGQTKTQFEIFASKNSNQDSKNGLAEASSQPDLSRATVSGLNGMGQAQGQSSSNDCDECHGHEYQVYQRPEDNSQPGYIPNVYRQNYNHVGSNTNSQLSGLQDEGSDQGSRQEPSINEQVPEFRNKE